MVRLIVSSFIVTLRCSVPYIVNTIDKRVDNVDNRLATDIKTLTEGMALLLFGDGNKTGSI